MVGRWLGLMDQQSIMWSHNSSEIYFLGFSPDGRSGHCLLMILA